MSELYKGLWIHGSPSGDGGQKLDANFTQLADWHEAGGGGVETFLELTDVPDSYAGQASKFVAVTAGGTGLEFKAIAIADVTGLSAHVADGSAHGATTSPTASTIVKRNAAGGIEVGSLDVGAGGAAGFVELKNAAGAYTVRINGAGGIDMGGLPVQMNGGEGTGGGTFDLDGGDIVNGGTITAETLVGSLDPNWISDVIPVGLIPAIVPRTNKSNTFWFTQAFNIIRAAAATASLPAVSFTEETTTGIYRPAANEWAVAVAGVQRFKATATGAAVAGDLSISGQLRPAGAQAGAYATLGAIVGRLPVYDQSGTLIGYAPLYNAIS